MKKTKEKNNLECPLCFKIIYSDIGKGCKMCGMPLQNKKNEFCSDKCRIKYFLINFNVKKL